ncbi:uncharacterized protein EV420DRAFT_1645934 [Desarmillaria tabescens]|uniref:Uncharacterized protein n=1 Tax=Armillaria tabescens TaxID=1929756 RepID=A0AA39K031_ARMTA|nr:uncharacterized protein EV420DRAFT_1645934 [Desarmillaria tabescens]KAK0451994.1 hypothetical protein EV420DRAFT_1645934 [Desarmillaria tabescens]
MPAIRADNPRPFYDYNGMTYTLYVDTPRPNTPDPPCPSCRSQTHLTLGVMTLTTETLPTALDLLHHLPTLPPASAPTIVTLDILRRESRRRAHVHLAPTSVQPNQRDLPRGRLHHRHASPQAHLMLIQTTQDKSTSTV